MYRSIEIEAIIEPEDILHIRFLRKGLLLNIFRILGNAVIFICFAWLLDIIVNQQFKNTFLFWFLLIATITMAVYYCVEPIRRIINKSYFVIDKGQGIIKADRRKDMPITNINAVRVTILRGESKGETEYALTLRTYNPNKPYRIDKSGNEKEIKTLAEMISTFLNVPLQLKGG